MSHGYAGYKTLQCWNQEKTCWLFTIESATLSFLGQEGPQWLGYEDKCDIKTAVTLCTWARITMDGQKFLENQKREPGSR